MRGAGGGTHGRPRRARVPAAPARRAARPLRLSATIQTHPARADLARELRARLGGRVGLTVDPDPEDGRSPWRTYREALDTTPAGATHRLIVQDDIDPCPHFLAAVRAAATAKPDDLLVFYVGGNAPQHASFIYRACAAGHQWARLNHAQFVPCVAVVWPVALVCPAVCWVEEQPWPSAFIADDEIIGRFCRAHDVFPLASVPSLVEHRTEVPSLMHVRQYDDPGRRAACLIGAECDARRIDWTLGP